MGFIGKNTFPFSSENKNGEKYDKCRLFGQRKVCLTKKGDGEKVEVYLIHLDKVIYFNNHDVEICPGTEGPICLSGWKTAEEALEKAKVLTKPECDKCHS